MYLAKVWQTNCITEVERNKVVLTEKKTFIENKNKATDLYILNISSLFLN